MSIIEQATKRLKQLERAGITVPWHAAKLATGADQFPGTVPEEQAAPVASVHGPESTGFSDKRASAAEAIVPQPGPAMRVQPDARTRVTLDLKGLGGHGYLVPDQERSVLAEQFRHLKRPLLMNARAKPGTADYRGTLIMVTSALPGEGKTFCSINLALSIASEVDTSVILVDADLVRPSVLTRLGIDAKPPGLLDMLTSDDLSLNDTIVATNIPKLRLMASGDPNKRSTELLASAKMDWILMQLSADYAGHVVIFDAPPVLLTTEAGVLASKVGQVVMVVEAFSTPRNAVHQAFERLRDCPLVLSVLNKCDEVSEERRYGHYYGPDWRETSAS